MFTLLVILIVFASVLLGLFVLIQNPKGGGFAAGIQSTQFMGVRQAADFLEKATWTLAIVILFLSMLTLVFKPKKVTDQYSRVKKYIEEANIQPANVPEGIKPIEQKK